MHKVGSALALFLAGMAPLAANAAPATYDFTLTIQGVGDVLPVAGISDATAGPFTGSFTLDVPMTPDADNQLTALTAFSLTIGTMSWSLGDINAYFSSDATGAFNPNKFQFYAFDFGGYQLSITKGIYTNLGWYLWDRGTSGCWFDTTEPYTGPLDSGCIGGGPDSVVLTERGAVASVPEPVTLSLFGAGLGLAAAIRRRRRNAA